MSYLSKLAASALVFCFLQPLAVVADEGEARLRPIGEVPINDLIQDTQYSSDDPDRVTLVWWLPDEFWEVSFAGDPTMTEEGTAEILDLVSEYTVAIFVDGKMGPFGGVRFVPPAQLRSQVKLMSAAGEVLLPLGDEDISQDMILLIGGMRPVLENMLGPMGENMAFAVFPRKDSKGQIIADASKAGSFEMGLGNEKFPVQTPLPSLLSVKSCGTCEREYRGDYSYCPYDRAELQHAE